MTEPAPSRADDEVVDRLQDAEGVLRERLAEVTAERDRLLERLDLPDLQGRERPSDSCGGTLVAETPIPATPWRHRDEHVVDGRIEEVE